MTWLIFNFYYNFLHTVNYKLVSIFFEFLKQVNKSCKAVMVMIIIINNNSSNNNNNINV